MSYLFGIKPNGFIHFGHEFCLKEYWTKDELFFLIADLHAYSSEEKKDIKNYTLEIIRYLQYKGIPWTNIILQSSMLGLGELYLLYSREFNKGYLDRMHLLKRKNDLKQKINLLEYTYTVLMCVDLQIFSQKDFVILGEDQKQHWECYQKLLKKVNIISQIKPIWIKSIAGLDGRKMSKSYNNFISLFDDNITTKINKIKTLNIKEVKEENFSNTLTDILNIFEEKDITYNRYVHGTNFSREKEILTDYCLREQKKLFDTVITEDILENIKKNSALFSQKILEFIHEFKKGIFL